LRILVVEHDLEVLPALVKSLEEDFFTVDHTLAGEKGLQLATVREYSAVILNRDIPNIGGLRVLTELRKSGFHTPVLMVSSGSAVSDRVHALQAGADDYLNKPFAMEELLARVHVLLRRPYRLLDKLCVGDLEIDPAQRRVKRAGTPIILSKQEYAVLEVLVRNAERTISRDTVVEGAWGVRYAELTYIVDVYVERLRAKIDRGFEQPLIHKVRGVGYRISAFQPPERFQ